MIAEFGEYWQSLERLGWLDWMTPEVRSANKAALERKFPEDPFTAFEIFTTGGYVLKTLQSDGDYIHLVQNYSEASRNVLLLSDIEDRFDHSRKVAWIVFSFRGQRFERTVPFESKYKPKEFDAWMEEVLRALGIRERFYELPSEGDVIGLTFMTPETHARAIEWGLLPRDWDEVEDARYDRDGEGADESDG